MKFIRLIINIVIDTYFSEVGPNLFGALNRRKNKEAIAGTLLGTADDTAAEIAAVKAENPYESAAAKAAMAKASRTAKLMQNRSLNAMGTGATAEAMVGMQGNIGETMGATAGQIAVGAEANKANELNALRGLQASQMGNYAQMASAAEDERGSGWTTFFQGLDALGGFATGTAGAAGEITRLLSTKTDKEE